jgi:GTPase SAR1 family protein
LVSFLGVSPYSQTTVVDVHGQDRFEAMHHEQGRESRGSARCAT